MSLGAHILPITIINELPCCGDAFGSKSENMLYIILATQESSICYQRFSRSIPA